WNLKSVVNVLWARLVRGVPSFQINEKTKEVDSSNTFRADHSSGLVRET
ncbi:hypothetical protein TorRG33x02_239920, partial [Trema orientale]